MEAVVREGKAKVLTTEEFNRLMRVVQVEMYPERNLAIMYMSFGLGLRVSEIASLQVEDVLENDDTLRDQFQIKIKNSKTRKNREVFLVNKKVRKALSLYLSCRRAHEGRTFNRHAPLFKTQKGVAFTGNSLQQCMKRLFRKAGLPDSVSSHSGRRGYCTRLINNGADIKAVSLLMGHSSIGQTAEYVQTNPDKLRTISAQAI